MKPAQTVPSGPLTILTTEDEGRSILHFEKGRIVFYQGDPADSVYYIRKGRVELTVVSHQGRQAVVGILEARDFFGEPCLGGQPFRIATARTMAVSSLLRIARAVMMRLLHEVPPFAELFTSWLLSRNIRIQEDLIDQLFNSGEKRLARALLLLAGAGKEGKIEAVIPKVSQETLAEMIGTSRQRVNYFMNKFRELGLIDYGDKLIVHDSLLNVVLRD